VKDSLITIAYIAASALFILSLGGLSRQETARRGNWYGIVGMVIALAATAARRDIWATRQILSRKGRHVNSPAIYRWERS